MCDLFHYAKGVGIVPFVNYYFMKGKKFNSGTVDNKNGCSYIIGNNMIKFNGGEPAFLFGKERFGNNAHKLNVIGGSIDKKDNGCVIGAAIRELREEAKISLSPSEFCDAICKHFFVGRTAIFVLKFRTLSTKQLNNIIMRDNNNSFLHHCCKELFEVRWLMIHQRNKKVVDIMHGKIINGNQYMSDYAINVLNIITNK